MGKPTGFLEFNRVKRKDTSVIERIKNWNEFHEPLNLDLMKSQTARCMDCGIPFCHMGLFLNGLASGCPIHNLIPEFNDLIYKGRIREAFDRLMKTNNFPEFTGRVCPAPCEGSCTVGLNKEPVYIKGVEEFIITTAYENGWMQPNPPKKRTNKKVAIVGSGPSGLTAADQLNKFGHNVTVFERADRIGGLLMYGIPNMKLDKNLVQKRINLMTEEGIKFITNKELGVNLTKAELEKEFDAIVLCCGATKPRDLEVEGREAKGVYFAMDFLTANTKRILGFKGQSPLENNLSFLGVKGDEVPFEEKYLPLGCRGEAPVSNFIFAKDKDVIIIGGGDTGTDCVATAIRHGAKSVTQLEIMPEPPKTRQENNPWPEWPKTLKVDYGQEEAIEIFGKDPREYCQMTKKIISENGIVKAIETVEIKWVKDENNRFCLQEIPGTTKTRPADLVFIAMGFVGSEKEAASELGITSKKFCFANKPALSDFTTDQANVFIAGDMRRGQSLVVWAINEGRYVAEACDQYLKNL